MTLYPVIPYRTGGASQDKVKLPLPGVAFAPAGECVDPVGALAVAYLPQPAAFPACKRMLWSVLAAKFLMVKLTVEALLPGIDCHAL